jgi:hypothetical protein
MPRIPYPDVSQLPELVQKRLASLPLNIVRICAHASLDLFEAQGALGRAVANPEALEPTAARDRDPAGRASVEQRV